jgi:hypothetical protein
MLDQVEVGLTARSPDLHLLLDEQYVRHIHRIIQYIPSETLRCVFYLIAGPGRGEQTKRPARNPYQPLCSNPLF